MRACTAPAGRNREGGPWPPLMHCCRGRSPLYRRAGRVWEAAKDYWGIPRPMRFCVFVWVGITLLIVAVPQSQDALLALFENVFPGLPGTALIINGASQKTGRRIITSNLFIDEKWFTDALGYFEMGEAAARYRGQRGRPQLCPVPLYRRRGHINDGRSRDDRPRRRWRLFRKFRCRQCL